MGFYYRILNFGSFEGNENTFFANIQKGKLATFPSL